MYSVFKFIWPPVPSEVRIRRNVKSDYLDDVPASYISTRLNFNKSTGKNAKLTDTIILSVCSSALNGTNSERRVQVVSRTSKNYSNSRIDFRTTATTNDGKDNRIDTRDFKCIAVSIYNDITQSNYMRVFVWLYSEISNITVDTYGFAAKENKRKKKRAKLVLVCFTAHSMIDEMCAVKWQMDYSKFAAFAVSQFWLSFSVRRSHQLHPNMYWILRFPFASF